MNDTRVLPVRKKRRSRPSLRSRLRTYWLLGAVVLAVGASALFELTTWSGFRLHHLEVAGLTRVDRDDVVRVAALDSRANVWLLDTSAVQRRIEAIPYVLSARLRRRFPGDVTIEVVEREPDGCLRAIDPTAGSGRIATIDGTRRVLELGCARAPDVTYAVRSAPEFIPGRQIVAPELGILQADAHRLAEHGRTFTTFELDRFGGLDAGLPSGIRVRFGDDADLARKASLVGPVLAAVANRIGAVRVVDVRAPATPVVEYR